MEVLNPTALVCYPPAPSNGGLLDASTPPKIGEWVWQPKVDDWRGVVHAPSLNVWNQYGERSCVERQRKLDAALEQLQATCIEAEDKAADIGVSFVWFDIGIMENRHDLMRGSIIVFDVMNTEFTHEERRIILEIMFPILPLASKLLANGHVKDGVYLINEWRDRPDVLGLQDSLKWENQAIGHKFYEGLVAKRSDAQYPCYFKPKQKTPVWVKHRFDQQ